MRTETGTQLKIYRMSSSTFTHWPVFDPAVRFSKIALRTVVVNSVQGGAAQGFLKLASAPRVVMEMWAGPLWGVRAHVIGSVCAIFSVEPLPRLPILNLLRFTHWPGRI